MADVETARHVGRAAVMVLLAVASEIREGAVLEAVWRQDQGRDAVSSLPGPIVEVFLGHLPPFQPARGQAEFERFVSHTALVDARRHG
jgi:hypothetical protein